MDCSGDSGISFTLERAINGLQSVEKNVVKQAINEINKVISKANSGELEELYKKLEKPLINALQGNVEFCREKTVSILSKFISDLDLNIQYLVLLIPAINKRISGDVSLESSEEVRDALINLLNDIISRYERHVSPYILDIVNILVAGISDPAPQVKKSSCSCTIKLSYTVQYEFFLHSGKFIPPLVESISHQHWRVRVAIIEAIGSTLQYGDNKLVPDVANPLAKRLFDDSPNVRIAVVKVVGNWLLKLNDRYSFFRMLLPHILTSLTDDNNEVLMTGRKYWEAIGKQFLAENENDYKDKIDYSNDILDHYPSGVKRAGLGCRCLIDREAYKFLPAISTELSDWLVQVRIKSAQLLSQVVLHEELHITQHINKILPAMMKAAADPEPIVAKYVKLSAEYMGYFVPPEVYTKIIVENVSESPTYGELAVVACLVSGSQRHQLSPLLCSLKHLFSTSTIKEAEQTGINELVKAIISVCQNDCLKIAEEMWCALVCNIGLAASEKIGLTSIDLLDELSTIDSEISKNEFHNKYCNILIEKLKKTNIWTVHCHEQYIFSGVVNVTGCIIGNHVTDFIQILKSSTSSDSEPEVVLKMLLASNDILKIHDSTLPSPDMLQHFIETFVNEILGTLLVWKAGRSAEALRSAGVLCLLSCFSLHPKMVISAELLATVLSLVEDASPKTRLLTIKSITCLVPTLTSNHTSFYEVTQVVLKRLDDCDGKVRHLAIRCIKDLYTGLLSTSDWKENLNKGLLEFVYTCLLIHLDDQDKSIQSDVLDCLIAISPADHVLLRDKISEDNFRDKSICQTLITHLEHKILCQDVSSIELSK